MCRNAEDSGVKSQFPVIENSQVNSQEAGLNALFLLGLGLASPLSSTSAEGADTQDKDIQTSDYSPEPMRSIPDALSLVGKQFKRLAAFSCAVRADLASSSTKIAVAESVSNIAHKVKEHLVQQHGACHSILQLETTFQRPGQLLNEVWQIASCIGNLQDDERILEAVYQWAQKFDFKLAWMRSIALSFLERISSPWLKALSECISLCQHSAHASHIQRRIERDMDLYIMEHNQSGSPVGTMPSFFAHQDVKLMLEIREALAYLDRAQNPFTPLTRGLPLRWSFTWPDIQRIQATASSLTAGEPQERAADRSLQDVQAHVAENSLEMMQDSLFNPYGRPKGVPQHFVSASKHLLDAPLKWPTVPSDALGRSVNDALAPTRANATDQKDVPPISNLPGLSFSAILSSQARLTYRLLLRELFDTHQLMHHLEIQHAFQLFGSGYFSARLTQALLSQDMTATESQRKQIGTGPKKSEPTLAGFSGRSLRLGSRTTWPPATSELRLALDGLLRESYHATFSPCHNRDLEGLPPRQVTPHDHSTSLSFSLRPLSSEDQVDATMDPRSLSALDFLQVSYRPPSILDAVMTTQAMEAYDASFVTLLRMARVLWTTRHSVVDRTVTRGPPLAVPRKVRLSQRLQIEMHRFVEEVSVHFKDTVDSVWTSFLNQVKESESHTQRTSLTDPHESITIRDEGALSSSRPQLGLRALREEHERALKNIGSALLLRHRQKQARSALDAALQTVLDSTRTDLSSSQLDDKTSQLKAFRDRVDAFLNHCAQLRSRERASHESSSVGTDNLLERLELAGWDRRQTWWLRMSISSDHAT